MATPGSFAGGFAAAVYGIFISIALFFAVGLPAEKLVATFEDMDIYDVPAEWGGYDSTTFWMNLLYVAIISPALVGIITMFLSSIRTQEYDVIDEPELEGTPYPKSYDELAYSER